MIAEWYANTLTTGSPRVPRYWATPQILIGGSILDAADALHLREAFDIHGILNCQNEDSDREKISKFPSISLLEIGQPDDGTPRDPEKIVKAISFAREVLHSGEGLYVHCVKGMVRSPSYAYAILRGVLAMTPENAFGIVQTANAEAWGSPDGRGPWGTEPRAKAYIASIEEALR